MYESQFRFSYDWQYSDVLGKSIHVEREMRYTNQTINLKAGYGFEIDFEYFYITAQIFYSFEILRKSTVNGYTDSSNYIRYSSNPTTLVSHFHFEENNRQYHTNSYYKYFVFALEIDKNFNHRISRVYIRSGLGTLYTEKIYSPRNKH